MPGFSDKEMNQRMRRGHVLDCLSRNEFPFPGWEREFPDIAAQRQREVKIAELELINVRDYQFPDGVSSQSCQADHLALQHSGINDAREFQLLFDRYYDLLTESL